MSTFEQTQIERYLPELTKLSHDSRLELIAQLSELLEGKIQGRNGQKSVPSTTFSGPGIRKKALRN